MTAPTHRDTDRRWPRRPRRPVEAGAAAPRTGRYAVAARIALVAGVVAAAAQALGATGPWSDAAFAALALSCLASIAVGVRVHRPDPRWPWAIQLAAVALFIVGGVARQAVGGFADLTADRPIAPDVVTLTGYALMAVGLLGMVRARYRNRPDGIDAVLDAGVTSLSMLSLAWVLFIGPALADEAAPAAIQLVLIAYPMMSSFLVAIMARLAFSAGSRIGFSFRMLLVAMFAIQVGDIVFMLGEVGAIAPHVGLMALPYTLAQATTAAAVLDPTMRDLTAEVPGTVPGLTRTRVALVAVALVLPPAITLFLPAAGVADRVAMGCIVALLTLLVVYRVIRAMTAQVGAQERLVHQATHDHLTGLPNRAYLFEHLPALMTAAHAQGHHVALLFLDVDRFKFVNDSLGHGAGDELLVTIARRLRHAVRSRDLVVRVGGDEFVVVLSDVVDHDGAVVVAERIRASFGVPVTVAGEQLVVSTSVGVVLSGGPADAVDDLVRDADSAMYQAKEKGRNSVAVFDQSMLERAARRLELDAELRRAVERDQLHVHYQPLVDLAGAGITGFEALMRWDHPTLGSVPPAEFIPIAEDTGLIVELGAWILDQACRQLAEWRDTVPGGHGLHVSVNVSARQLQRGRLPAVVAATLDRWDLPPGALWLELTESLLLDDPSAMATTLHDLRASGVQLSLDDFGTGYSSLAHLKRFPVDRVKIDRAFVNGLADTPTSDESLIAAIVAMARALGLSTVAEGVETDAQARRLRELGVDAGQGYRFARPEPAGAIPEVLSRLGLARTPKLRVVPSVA